MCLLLQISNKHNVAWNHFILMAAYNISLYENIFDEYIIGNTFYILIIYLLYSNNIISIIFNMPLKNSTD